MINMMVLGNITFQMGKYFTEFGKMEKETDKD